eukprot:Lithocolla_globosa_v1_NODE_762_length_3323_cov_18.216340.p3 type:complete len:178 gc:universal NODE_762_length_3323_cov_18.216340:1107-574(-)
MPGPLSSDLRWRVLLLFLTLTGSDIDRFSIAGARYNVHPNTVSNWVDLYKRTGDVEPGPYAGRLRLLNDDEMSVLVRILESEPSLYLDELRDKFYLLTGCYVDVSTICRWLIKNDYTRKRIERIARAQDDYLRALYIADIINFTIDQLIFVDESGCDRRHCERSHGYASWAQADHET